MEMEDIYSAGPTNVPANLSKPRRAYKQRAILATIGLLMFALLYCLLTGWFIWTAYRLSYGSETGQSNIFVGLLSAFLAVFMLKPLFRFNKNEKSSAIEISQREEPKLFEFLYRLADEAQAPRPHKVFLSPSVNAGVFYDISIWNLLFPSKKNLDIGLGLVNILTLGEMKAVLAHEFGHFAQRSMAVGRWVYIAQQIAARIVTERDALDNFLRILSRVDVRIAWIGWLLSLIVWSIRSLLETAFGWLVIAQRALSREMEFQADLVAVSLTGSDSLVHALHRLHAADDAWDRTLRFAASEMQNGRLVADLFALQTEMVDRVRIVLNDLDYGRVPPLPVNSPEHHRLFRAELTEPPRMWATHPPNLDREDNAKRVYIAAPLDDRPAWALFTDSQATRERMTVNLFQGTPQAQEAQTVPLPDSLARLEQQFSRLHLDRNYRGAYLGRSAVCYAATHQELCASIDNTVDLDRDLNSLYPESLGDDLEQLRVLEAEKQALEALRDRRAKAAGGIIQHRGRTLQRQDLTGTIQELDRELAATRERVYAHDRLCRTTHRTIARRLGNGWEEYLSGLLAILHYTDRTEADLSDARGYLNNVLVIITADRNVSRTELFRLLKAAAEVYLVLERIYSQRQQVNLDTTLLEAFEKTTWSQALGEFKLSPPNEHNINDWMNAIDSWLEHTRITLSALKSFALEQLLHSEKMVANAFRQSQSLPLAPEASSVPSQYPVLLPGQERKLQTRLGWWDRFQTADGVVPEILRLLVASGVIVPVLWFGATIGK